MKQRISRARRYVTGGGLGPFLVRSVAGSGVVQLGGMIATFLVGVQLARGLGVTGYGYYGIAMAVITLAMIPGTFGIPKLVTREVAAAQSRDEPALIFGVLRWADRVCGRISALIAGLIAVGGLIAWRNGSPVVGLTILCGAPMVALLPLAAIRGAGLRGLHRVVLGQLANVLFRPLAMAILLFAILVAGVALGAPAVMALNSIIAALALLLTHRWLTRSLPTEKPTQPRLDSRGWLAASIPMALGDAVMTLQRQLAVLLLGVLAAAAEVGLFRASIATAAVLTVPLTVVNIVVLPMFSRLHIERDQARLQKVVTASALIQFAGVLVLSLPLLVAAGPLFALVFGNSYAPAADTIRVLAAGAIFGAAVGPNAPLLNMTGHERRVTRAVAIALVINIALVAILAPTMGSLGTAISVVAGQCCWNVILWQDARRRLSVDTSILGVFLLLSIEPTRPQ
jgi:O-antigen/teichoic acid export membrane protein